MLHLPLEIFSKLQFMFKEIDFFIIMSMLLTSNIILSIFFQFIYSLSTNFISKLFDNRFFNL